MFVVCANNVALGVYPTMALACESVMLTLDGVVVLGQKTDHYAEIFSNAHAFTVVQVKPSEAAGRLF